MKDRPFALIGVNSDDSKETYRIEAEKNGVTWRSSWQGSTFGPWPTLWGVQAWPATYILDENGVIRVASGSGLNGEALDAEIDALVERAEKAAAKE